MWREVVNWLMGPVQTKASQSPEEFERAFESRVRALEERAEHSERVAALRVRAMKANERVKAVTPRGRYLLWVMLGVGVLVLFSIVKSCL